MRLKYLLLLLAAFTVASTNTASDDACQTSKKGSRIFVDDSFGLPVEEIKELLFTRIPWHERLSQVAIEAGHEVVTQRVSGMMAGEWTMNRKGQRQRTLKYTMHPNSTFVSESQVEETQTCLSNSDENFTIRRVIKNSGFVFADTFVVEATLCASTQANLSTHISVTASISGTSGVYMMVSGLIEPGVFDGLKEYYTGMSDTLNLYAEMKNNATTSTIEMQTSHGETAQINSLQAPLEAPLVLNDEVTVNIVESTPTLRAATHAPHLTTKKVKTVEDKLGLSSDQLAVNVPTPQIARDQLISNIDEELLTSEQPDPSLTIKSTSTVKPEEDAVKAEDDEVSIAFNHPKNINGRKERASTTMEPVLETSPIVTTQEVLPKEVFDKRGQKWMKTADGELRISNATIRAIMTTFSRPRDVRRTKSPNENGNVMTEAAELENYVHFAKFNGMVEDTQSPRLFSMVHPFRAPVMTHTSQSPYEPDLLLPKHV